MTNRRTSLSNLKNRRNPDLVLKEAFAQLQEDEAIVYLAGAMEQVDPDYTARTFEEADRVKNQLLKGLEADGLSAEFVYQGSVTKNTHIRAYSDIDLLMIEKRFVSLEHPQVPKNPYGGVPEDDLAQLRELGVAHLSKAFPEATVDSTGAKSFKISGGSLKRTIDVVPANWYHTNAYAQHGHDVYKGVHILDYNKRGRYSDQPFIHALLLNHKDGETAGNTRKLVRLLKSLRYDSEGKCSISSYDIESIVYRIDNSLLTLGRGQEIQLASVCLHHLNEIEADPELRASLLVPDGKRAIFAEGKATLPQLSALRKELAELMSDIELGVRRSFKNLDEARVGWRS